MEELSLKDLSPYQKRLDIIEKTAAQVQKDFGTFNHEISFSGNTETAYEELYEQVLMHMSSLWEKQQDNFWNILYRIDLDENQTRKALQNDNPIELLTDMILQRELKKVVIREYYK